MRNAKKSVRLVTVMEAPASASALPSRVLTGSAGSWRSNCVTITNMSSTPIPSRRKGATDMSGL